MTGQRKSLLVISDDLPFIQMLIVELGRLGHTAYAIGSLAAAEQHIQTQEPAFILLDLAASKASGMEAIAALHHRCPVVALLANDSVEMAIQAMVAGAADVLIKPVLASRLRFAVVRALEKGCTHNNAVHRAVRERSSDRMIGQSDASARIAEGIAVAAHAETPVLIEGETGVGKQCVAESIHAQSLRNTAPFVRIDCTTLNEQELEAALFGREEEASTGTHTAKLGAIEEAKGGTIFLEALADISPAIQAKLLQVLKANVFQRQGGTRDVPANVRVMAATNRKLSDFVRAGTFRRDLFDRLGQIVISVPPLRERQEDILPIARHLLKSRAFMRGVPKDFHPASEQALKGYAWPGNIHELHAVVDRGVLLSADQPLILPHHLSLPSTVAAGSEAFALTFDHSPTMDEVKDVFVAKMLAVHGGNKSRAARAMGISERNMYRLTGPADRSQ